MLLGATFYCHSMTFLWAGQLVLHVVGFGLPQIKKQLIFGGFFFFIHSLYVTFKAQ